MDLQTVDALIQGDSQAWRRFIDKYGRLIRARIADVATSFGRRVDDAEVDDATADVFTALLNNDYAALRAFAGRSSLATYVAVIATRCATRAYARKRMVLNADRSQDSENQSTERPDNRVADPLQALLAQEQNSALHTVLATLPEKQRKVVELFHLNGCRYAEISQILKIPMGSVGVTLKRAEAKLREALGTD